MMFQHTTLTRLFVDPFAVIVAGAKQNIKKNPNDTCTIIFTNRYIYSVFFTAVNNSKRGLNDCLPLSHLNALFPDYLQIAETLLPLSLWMCYLARVGNSPIPTLFVEKKKKNHMAADVVAESRQPERASVWDVGSGGAVTTQKSSGTTVLLATSHCLAAILDEERLMAFLKFLTKMRNWDWNHACH